MPQVQFARADLPWLFTPAAPGTAEDAAAAVAGARHRPPPGRRAARAPATPLPVLELARRRARPSCPTSRSRGRGRTRRSPGLARRRPARRRARLRPRPRPARGCVCPRHLEPDTAYLACLVPGLPGRRQGRARRAGDRGRRGRLEPAWSRDARRPAAPAGLPRVGVRHRARRGASRRSCAACIPSPLDPASARPPKLDLSAPGQRAAGRRRRSRCRARCACPARTTPPPWPDARGPVPGRARADCSRNAPPDVARAAGLRAAAGRCERAAAAGAQPAWLRELNLDPRLRVAAAAGTRVVQERQEQLMARAWEQAGAVNDANALLRRHPARARARQRA